MGQATTDVPLDACEEGLEVMICSEIPLRAASRGTGSSEVVV